MSHLRHVRAAFCCRTPVLRSQRRYDLTYSPTYAVGTSKSLAGGGVSEESHSSTLLHTEETKRARHTAACLSRPQTLVSRQDFVSLSFGLTWLSFCQGPWAGTWERGATTRFVLWGQFDEREGKKAVCCVLLAPRPWQTSDMRAESDSASFAVLSHYYCPFITSYSVLFEAGWTRLRVMGRVMRWAICREGYCLASVCTVAGLRL